MYHWVGAWVKGQRCAVHSWGTTPPQDTWACQHCVVMKQVHTCRRGRLLLVLVLLQSGAHGRGILQPLLYKGGAVRNLGDDKLAHLRHLPRNPLYVVFQRLRWPAPRRTDGRVMTGLLTQLNLPGQNQWSQHCCSKNCEVHRTFVQQSVPFSSLAGGRAVEGRGGHLNATRLRRREALRHAVLQQSPQLRQSRLHAVVCSRGRTTVTPTAVPPETPSA